MITEIVYNPWRSKIDISYQAPKFWDVENPEKSTDYGNLIHQLLSEIKTLDDLQPAFNRYITRGLIAESEGSKIMDQLNEIMKITEVKSLFVDFKEIKNETTILLPSGESYQPDRVIITDNKTIIVDYKSGEQKKSHFEQLENYKNLLSEMGYTNIESYLLYIKDEKLVQVL